MEMIPGSEVIGDSDESRALRNPVGALLLDRKLFTWRGVLIGVLCSLLFHFLGLWVVPDDFFEAERVDRKGELKEYEILLVEPEEEEVYTQTNKDVPDNVPDETNRFAARNQQAANVEKAEELDPENRPASKSDDDIETDQFLTGDLSDPVLAPLPVEPQEQVDVSSETPQLRREVPIFGEELEEDEEGTGVMAYEFDEKLEDATNVAERLKGETEDGEDVGEKAVDPNYESALLVPQEYVPPSPRPRPQLPRVNPGPVRNSNLGVSNVGAIAVDAKFSEFGEYMERFVETVGAHWNFLCSERKTRGNKGVVKLRFRLTKEGFIEDLKTDEGTSSKAIGIYLARTAVQEAAPYGLWTPEMVKVLGDDDEVTFSFYYR